MNHDYPLIHSIKQLIGQCLSDNTMQFFFLSDFFDEKMSDKNLISLIQFSYFIRILEIKSTNLETLREEKISHFKKE